MKGASRLFKALFGGFWVLLFLFSITMQSFAGVPGEGVPTIQWTRQFGTSAPDEALGVSVHASGVYVAGRTDGALPGQTRVGATDAFVRKYDLDGNEVWTRQFGVAFTSLNQASGVSVDASGVYVAGFIGGALPGQTSAGASTPLCASTILTATKCGPASS